MERANSLLVNGITFDSCISTSMNIRALSKAGNLALADIVKVTKEAKTKSPGCLMIIDRVTGGYSVEKRSFAVYLLKHIILGNILNKQHGTQ